MDKHTAFGWRRSTTYILLGGLTLVLLWLVGAYMWTNFRPTEEVRLSSGVFQLWVADDDKERIKGLSGEPQLAPNGGLLMKFDYNDTWGIWMKDMLQPLDIIWLDQDKKVIYIVTDAQPEEPAETVFFPVDPALYVIELPAGSVEQHAIKLGQEAYFDIDEGTE